METSKLWQTLHSHTNTQTSNLWAIWQWLRSVCWFIKRYPLHFCLFFLSTEDRERQTVVFWMNTLFMWTNLSRHREKCSTSTWAPGVQALSTEKEERERAGKDRDSVRNALDYNLAAFLVLFRAPKCTPLPVLIKLSLTKPSIKCIINGM